MTGANDWTIDIETKGLPELKALYRLYGAEDKVMAKCFPQFAHNYNQVSREVMYNWFNKHLNLGLAEPVVEKEFKPATKQELSVYTEEHPHPTDALPAERLREVMTAASTRQINALLPKDAQSLTEFKSVFGTVLRGMIADQLPQASEVVETRLGDMEKLGDVWLRRYLLGRKGQNEQIPVVGVMGKEFDGMVVVWVHPEGKSSLWKSGKLVPAAQQIIDAKGAILAVDVFGTGELSLSKPSPIDAKYAGFTFGYNRSLLANRVHDILTAVVHGKNYDKVKTVHLVGFDKAGPWVLLARDLCGDAVVRTAADWNEFRFEKVRSMNDEMLLPGRAKYGDLPALAAVSAPHEIFIHNHKGAGAGRWMKGPFKPRWRRTSSRPAAIRRRWSGSSPG